MIFRGQNDDDDDAEPSFSKDKLEVDSAGFKVGLDIKK